MLKKLKNITLRMMAGANLASIAVMWLVGYSDRIDPVSFPILSTAGLIFPLFILINVLFLLFWICFKFKGVIIPVVGFLVCFVPMRKYAPLNLPQDNPNGAIKILSYNVWGFGSAAYTDSASNPIIEYIKAQNADIVCLQEAATNAREQARIDSILNPIYAHRDTARNGFNDLISIYSKHPIIGKEHIDYASKSNLSAAFKLNIDGKEVIVVNNHLESTGITIEERNHFHNLINGKLNTDTASRTSKLLIKQLAVSAKKRAPQAEAVARYVAFHRETPIIVCGDFNDGPISYTHRAIAKDLTDCYVATANGPGISYHKSSFFVRIDNILCSPHFTPYGCKVDNRIKASDHYPIYCWLKIQGNTKP